MSKYKGSKRAMLEFIGSPNFISNMNNLLKDVGTDISKIDSWLPTGFHSGKEGELKDFLKEHFNLQLATNIKKWWLHNNGRTPNWDLISTCTINGERGILLVEAKAHVDELKKENKGKPFNERTSSEKSKLNHKQIALAIEEANIGINKVISGLSISRNNCYQLSNRIAHAWWLANKGIPVVLLYLGFLNSDDMRDKYKVFNTDLEWKDCFKEHAKIVAAHSLINKTVNCGESSFVMLSRSC
jgi:hypothetical protein